VADFHKLGSTEDVSPGEIRYYSVEGRHVALCNVEGEFHAFEDVCTHQFAHLSEGGMQGDRVKCPLHGAVFDVRTGQPKSLPAVKPLVLHTVKVEDGSVYVALNPKRVKVRGNR
jgi:nitrite reductase/ring-hydroxylating ferredoxin subunit